MDESSPADSTTGSLAHALRGTDSGVAVFAGPNDASSAYTEQLISSLVQSDSVDISDVRYANASKDRWTVAEVAEEILGPIRTQPHGRCWVVVVSDAASMDTGGATRLLRSIEEPPTPAWWLLCHGNHEELSAAVTGRVQHTVRFSDGDLTAKLRETAERAGVDLDTLLGSSNWGGDGALSAATEWVARAREHSKNMKPPPAGVWLRRICSTQLDQFEGQVRDVVRSGDITREQEDAAGEFCAALDTARTALRLFTPPEAPMAVVWSAYENVQRAVRVPV